MERIAKYRKAILEVMEDYINKRKTPEAIEFQIITDDVHHRYQLVMLGWQDRERIYHMLMHMDLIADKIWVQEDNTEYGAANFLLEKRIDKKEIVLAYFSEFHRKQTEYAVA